MRSVVVFPAPFGPRKPLTVPGSSANDRSSTATRFAEALGQRLGDDDGCHGAHPKTTARGRGWRAGRAFTYHLRQGREPAGADG